MLYARIINRETFGIGMVADYLTSYLNGLPFYCGDKVLQVQHARYYLRV